MSMTQNIAEMEYYVDECRLCYIACVIYYRLVHLTKFERKILQKLGPTHQGYILELNFRLKNILGLFNKQCKYGK